MDIVNVMEGTIISISSPTTDAFVIFASDFAFLSKLMVFGTVPPTNVEAVARSCILGGGADKIYFSQDRDDERTVGEILWKDISSKSLTDMREKEKTNV